MLRVLALDDDNHSCMYVTETGVTYENACEFIKYLAQPHIEPVEVRGFAIIDPVSEVMGNFKKIDNLKDLEDDVIDDLFYFVEGVGSMQEDIPFSAAFDMLWSSSKEWWRS